MKGQFVLVDTLATKKRGKPVFFGGMSGIGPRFCEEFSSAIKFEDKNKAMESPAFSHSLCFFEPQLASQFEQEQAK